MTVKYFYVAWLLVKLRLKTAINLYPAKLISLNFQPLEVVFRYRDPQIQGTENHICLI